jgi:proteasome lid subunit RPN8/RPN11
VNQIVTDNELMVGTAVVLQRSCLEINDFCMQEDYHSTVADERTGLLVEFFLRRSRKANASESVIEVSIRPSVHLNFWRRTYQSQANNCVLWYDRHPYFLPVFSPFSFLIIWLEPS